MSTLSDTSTFRSKKSLYKFCLHKVSKLKPHGNLLQGTECPKARSGHRIVFHCGNIYSFGGYNPVAENEGQPVLFKELWKFNLASKTWTKLNPSGVMPEELASHAAELINDHMLIYGGTGMPFGDNSSNSVHICNLKTLKWSTLKTSGSPPLEQYGQAIAVSENKLYVVGGTTGYDYSIDVHSLDLATKQWKLHESRRFEPEPRYRHEIVIQNQRIFVFGGGTSDSSFGFKVLPMFNLEDGTWSFIPTSEAYPHARRCHGCVKIGNDVYISGGQHGQTTFSDIWKINLKTLLWEQLSATLPDPVFFHSATLSPAGLMFIFGGVTNYLENTRTNDLYSVWLKIPSLAEMSWQAVSHYIPHIEHLDRHKLLEAGVPIKYINQIDTFTDNDDHMQ